MRTISVDSYPITRTSASAPEAVRLAKSHPPLSKARADEQCAVGGQLIDAFWTDTDFVIRLSTCRLLHIFVDPKNAGSHVNWQILDAEPIFAGAELMRVGTPPVRLKFPRAGECIMDCSKMIAARRGGNVQRFFVSELGFYLYMPQQRILCFFSVFRTDTGENLLYVHEEE
jgi:hypothetical protein